MTSLDDTKTLALSGVNDQGFPAMMRMALAWVAIASALAGETLVWEFPPMPPDGRVTGASDGTRIVRVVREESDWEPTGTFRIQSSADGLEWSSFEVPIPDIQNASSLSSVCHADGTWFVKISDRVYKSTNGSDWLERSVELPDVQATAPNRWLFGNGWHVNAVPSFFGVATNDAPIKLRSQDGLSWIRIDQDFDDALTQAFGGGKFVVLSDSTRYTSVDGEFWEAAPTSGLADYPGNLTYHRGRWLCTVSQAGNHALLISDDAANWQPVHSGYMHTELSGHDSLGVVIVALQEPVWSGGYIVAHLYSSEDGFRWKYLGPRPGTNFLG